MSSLSCAANTADERPVEDVEASSGRDATSVDVEEMRFEPLGVLDRSADDILFVERAIDALTAPCMAALGFEYFSAIGVLPLSSTSESRYPSLEVATARKFGYRPTVTSADAPMSIPAVVDTEDYLLGLWGDNNDPSNILQIVDIDGNISGTVGRGGCRGTAERFIYGDFAAYESLRQQIETARNDSISKAYGDPRWSSVEEEWRSCISAKGFEFDSPIAASESIYFDPAAPPAPEEIRLAVADAECRSAADFDLLRRIDYSYQVEFVEKNPALPEAFLTLWNESVARSKACLDREDSCPQ